MLFSYFFMMCSQTQGDDYNLQYGPPNMKRVQVIDWDAFSDWSRFEQ